VVGLELVKELFNEGANLRDIRLHLFQIPNRFPRLSEFRNQEGYENLSKEDYKATASEFYAEQAFYGQLILHDLDCTSYEDYDKKKKRRYSSKQQKARGGAAWRKRKKEARERDGNKCVITGVGKPLFVHHINGDKAERRLENLVTISREVNNAIHHGARDFHPDDVRYWESKNPEYVAEAATRLELLKKYVRWLRTHGYQSACLESLPLNVLNSKKWRTGANKDIHFSMYRRRNYQNHFWIALLEPTGLVFEKQPFEDIYKKTHGRSYSYSDYEEKCEACPYEGEPPCGDYHIGPYCYYGRQSCASCRLDGTDQCPYAGKEHGEHTRVSICSKWEKVLDE